MSGLPDAPRGSRGPRSDALRNRQRVVQAASEIFAEQGIRASVADVAARAGVGNATVYRSYRTKTDLLAEVAVLWLQQMERESAVAAAADDPAAAFAGLVDIVFERLRGDRLAADLLREGNLTDEVARTRVRVEANWTTALRRAAEAGAVRDDVTYADLSVLILGTAERLSEMGVTDPARWRRTAEFVRAAIAAPALAEGRSHPASGSASVSGSGVGSVSGSGVGSVSGSGVGSDPGPGSALDSCSGPGRGADPGPGSNPGPGPGPGAA